MSVKKEIEARLQADLNPIALKVVDQSAAHVGHAGARPEGESHFFVSITASAFEGLSRVQRQRRVHAALDALLKGPVHALSIEARAPGEADGSA